MTFNSLGNPSSAVNAPVAANRVNPAQLKKSHKGLKITLITLGIVLVLAVASFFVVKMILRNMEVQYMKENPSAYLMNSYGKTVDGLKEENQLIAQAAPDKKQNTVKISGEQNNLQYDMCYACDTDAGKAYMNFSLSNQKVSAPISATVFTAQDKSVIAAEINNNVYDYYISNDENLRENAKKSALGPKGENLLGHQ